MCIRSALPLYISKKTMNIYVRVLLKNGTTSKLFHMYCKSKAVSSLDFTPLIYTKGWGCGWVLSIVLKNGIHVKRITLWALILWSSHARVTSVKSSSVLSSPKDSLVLSWKSSYLRHGFLRFILDSDFVLSLACIWFASGLVLVTTTAMIQRPFLEIV